MLFRSEIVKRVYRLRKQIFLQPGWKFSEYGVSDLVVEFDGSGIMGLSRLPLQIIDSRWRQHGSVVLFLDYFFVLRGRWKD